MQYCVLAALDDGDCWVEYEDLLDRANTLLVMDTLDSRDVIEGHLEALIAEGVLFSQPFERLVVADPEIHKMERELAEVLRTASAPNPHAIAELDGLLDAEGAELNAEQRDAVKNALSYSISLMTGGAGSGKTYAVSTITSIAERLELSVVLAAPTGKAAKRLEQVVGHEASTIHRLLGFNGHTYSRDALNPIEADILVIDEVSMVDVPLAWRLFQAVNREKTAVVLVGDHNQLPPVGPGNLLRDLVKSRAIPTTVLTRIIRQAGELKENSTAILAGEVRPTSEVKTGARRPWYVIDKFTDAGDVRRMLLLLFDEVLHETARLRSRPRRPGADADAQGAAGYSRAEHRAAAPAPEEAVPVRCAGGRCRAQAPPLSRRQGDPDEKRLRTGRHERRDGHRA